jgi:hypothetical protein
MKAILPWFLFAVSGVFNALFLVGMATKPPKHTGRLTPEDRTAFFARKLDLDEGQRSAFLELEKKAEEERSRIDRERGQQFDAVMRELAKEGPDEAVVKDFVKAGNATNRRERLVDHMRAVMKILRPDQRVKAAEAFLHHGGDAHERGSSGR